MNQLYAAQAISVTELKKHYAAVVAQADGEAVVVLNNNKPEVYLVPADAYEQLIERLEDLEDSLKVLERQNNPAVAVNMEDLRAGRDI